MQFLKILAAGLVLAYASLSVALPENGDFVTSTEFPATAAFGWVGTAQPDGTYLIWNGDTIYAQKILGKDD